MWNRLAMTVEDTSPLPRAERFERASLAIACEAVSFLFRLDSLGGHGNVDNRRERCCMVPRFNLSHFVRGVNLRAILRIPAGEKCFQSLLDFGGRNSDFNLALDVEIVVFLDASVDAVKD